MRDSERRERECLPFDFLHNTGREEHSKGGSLETKKGKGIFMQCQVKLENSLPVYRVHPKAVVLSKRG